MIAAIDRPTSGQVIVDGTVVSDAGQNLTKWRARNIGIVFQFFQLLPTLTISNNVIFPMDYADVHPRSQRREIALDLLEQYGIRDQAEKTPDMLSGGQRQRAAIVRGLANHPPLLIGDEPTSALDYMNAKNVYEDFKRLADNGMTVIVATYDYEIVRNAPKVLELKDGILQTVNLEEKETQVA
jgi:putative ABC transport system ATP-binding protein